MGSSRGVARAGRIMRTEPARMGVDVGHGGGAIYRSEMAHYFPVGVFKRQGQAASIAHVFFPLAGDESASLLRQWFCSHPANS